MAKFVSLDEAVALIPDGASIMVGGFMGCGNPHKIIDALSKSGKGNFTLICNDGSMPGGPLGEDYYGVAKLIHNGQVTHLIATHVGDVYKRQPSSIVSSRTPCLKGPGPC